MTIYRHFKGNLYEFIGEARHSETQERLVIYRPIKITGRPQREGSTTLHWSSSQEIWARPYEMFFGEKDGEPRFKQMSNEKLFELFQSTED